MTEALESFRVFAVESIAKPFVEAQLPGYNTYVMGGHLMFYEYPEKWNHVLEDFLNKL